MADPNPWLERRVLNWAHQGGAKEGPSTTLLAMRDAVAAGAHAIELDVHMTADGVLVCCHDATVDRTTNGSGAIANLTLEEVRTLDNAYWWVPGSVVDHDPNTPESAYIRRGEGHLIPTLDEVLEALPDTYLNFDIKQTSPAVKPYETKLADALQAHGRTDDVIVASFDDGATMKFRDYAPDFHTSCGMAATAEFYYAVRDGKEPPATAHSALQVPRASGETVIVTERFVLAAHDAGLAVHVWTIDDPGEMAELIAFGVDGVMTDRPAVLAGVLGATPGAGT